MSSRVFRATLVVLVACTAVVSATPSLFLGVSGPEAVADVDNFKVTATITNTGDEVLQVLNDPHSAISELPADTFKISGTDGVVPSFNGVKVKYVYSTAIAAGKEAITVLEPGESIEIEHDLSEAYDFSGSGEGVYSVEANNLFYIVNSDNEPTPLYADTEAHTAELTGKLAAIRPTELTVPRFNKCTRSQQVAIGKAASIARNYTGNSLSHLRRMSRYPATRRYTTWFGARNRKRLTTVQSRFQSISKNNFMTYTYDCSCKKKDLYAYVYPNTFGIVYFCGAFWRASMTGTDSKAGTVVHEASHFTRNGGTDDVAYGQTKCQALAKSHPDSAIKNADSVEYYAENYPALASTGRPEDDSASTLSSVSYQNGNNLCRVTVR